MIRLGSYSSDQDDFNRAFGLSLALHVALALFFFIKLSFFSKPMIDISQAISVNIAESPNSNRLPEKVPPAAPAPSPAAVEAKPEAALSTVKEKVTKVKPPAKEELNLSKVKSKEKAAFEKIKKMSAIEKIKEEVSKEDGKAKSKLHSQPRVISAGTPLTGLDKIEAGEYLQSLDYNIKQAWTLPQWLAKKKLQAQVLVKFNTAGQLLATKVILSSGNTSYDNFCLEAINKAAPFPKVPEKFSEKFSVDGMVVGFPE